MYLRFPILHRFGWSKYFLRYSVTEWQLIDVERGA